MARTFALIAPIHTILHRVSWSYKTILNAPKHYATHQNISSGTNRVDWMRSLRKIPFWLRGTYFCINCTCSHYFAPSFMQLRNDPKCTQTLCNAPKHEFRVQWGGWVRSLWKIRTCIRGMNFCINSTNSHRFAPSFMQLRNYNKCTQTQWNLWKHKLSVQWGGLGGFIAKNPDMTSWHELLH